MPNTKQPGANSGNKKKASCVGHEAGTKRARKSKEPSITKDTNCECKICKKMEHGNHFVQVLKHRGHKRFQSMVCCSHKQFGGEEQALRAAEAFLQLCIDGYSKEQLGWAKAEYLKHLSSNKQQSLDEHLQHLSDNKQLSWGS